MTTGRINQISFLVIAALLSALPLGATLTASIQLRRSTGVLNEHF